MLDVNKEVIMKAGFILTVVLSVALTVTLVLTSMFYGGTKVRLENIGGRDVGIEKKLWTGNVHTYEVRIYGPKSVSM